MGNEGGHRDVANKRMSQFDRNQYNYIKGREVLEIEGPSAYKACQKLSCDNFVNYYNEI